MIEKENIIYNKSMESEKDLEKKRETISRAEIKNIVEEFIKPQLQNALRAGQKTEILTEPIDDLMKQVTPNKITIKIFISDLRVNPRSDLGYR